VDKQLMNFGRNVLAQMAHQKLSAAMLAKRAGIAPKTLNNLLRARHAPQLDVLAKIAEALGVELWQLWLPVFPDDTVPDETFPRIVETVA
jgi:transcriptional regulator with XRE-family HTH domain